MAVAYDASSESHTGTTGSQSEASFSWTHTPVGSPTGALIFVMQDTSSTDKVSSVTYGGTTVPAVTGGRAADTVGEPRSCKAFFLSNPPSGAKTVLVTRTNDTTVMYAVAITVTSSVASTEVYLPGIVLQQADTALSEQSVDDGSPGSNSVRFAAIASALGSAPNAGAHSTAIQTIDFGASTARVVRQTTAGQGSLPVGFNDSSDDVAAVYLAVREAANVVTVTVTPGSITLSSPGGWGVEPWGTLPWGTGASVVVTRTTSLSPAAVTFAGAVVTIARKYTVTPGAVTFLGKTIILSGGTTFVVDLPGSALWDDPVATWSGSATWAGGAVASVVLAGQSITVQSAHILVTPGAVTHAGASIAVPRAISATSGTITLAGQEIAFTGVTTFIVDTPGALTLAGAAVAIGRTFPVTAGAVSFLGVIVALSSRVPVTNNALALQGQAIAVAIPFSPPAQTGGPPTPAPGLERLHKLRKHYGLVRR